MKQICSPHLSTAVPLQNLPAEESARQGQKCFMDVSPLFTAHTQTAELIEPSEGSLHHPPPSAQSTAMFGVALGEGTALGNQKENDNIDAGKIADWRSPRVEAGAS